MPLDDTTARPRRDVHRGDRGDALLIVCNPNNPTATQLPVEEIAAFMEKVPARVTVILDEAYIEFQTNDDPDASLDLLKDFPNLVVLRTFSKCYGLAGLRVGYAIGSSNFRAAVDAVRQPFSVNALAQAAGAEAILHQDDCSSGSSDPRRADPRQEGVRGLGLGIGVAGELLLALPRRPRRSGRHRRSCRAESSFGPARRSAPRPLRVTYGTPAENDRFLSALAQLLTMSGTSP